MTRFAVSPCGGPTSATTWTTGVGDHTTCRLCPHREVSKRLESAREAGANVWNITKLEYQLEEHRRAVEKAKARLDSALQTLSKVRALVCARSCASRALPGRHARAAAVHRA